MPRIKQSVKNRKKNITKANINYKKSSLAAKLRRNETKSLIVTSKIDQKEIESAPLLEEYYRTDQKNVLKALIGGLIRRECLLIPCPHYYVSASQVLNLLSCTLTPSNSHQFMKNTRFSKFGTAAEVFFERTYNVTKGSPVASKQLPFLCGTPDFIIGNKVVEIKSGIKPKSLTKESLLQTLIYLEILGLSEAEIRFYHTEPLSNQEYNITLTEIVGIKKSGTVFFDDFIIHACKGYMTYIGLLLYAQKIEYDEAQLTSLMRFFIDYSKQHKKGYIRLPEPKVMRMCTALSYMKFSAKNPPKVEETQRWSNSYTHSISQLNDVNKPICLAPKRYKEAFGYYESYQDIYSRIFTNDDDDTISRDSYDKKMSAKAPPRFDKYSIEINETEGKMPVKRAICIREEDIKRLFTLYCDIRELGIPLSDFDFID